VGGRGEGEREREREREREEMMGDVRKQERHRNKRPGDKLEK
jgi:hypothetical protein